MDINETGQRVADINRHLLQRGIFGGKVLSADFPHLGQCAQYCVTEMTDIDDIARLTATLGEILS